MNSEEINKLTNETLSSLDGAKRAAAKPFLFTRLTAKMRSRHEGRWDNALRFLSKPAVAFACVLFVIGINAAVFTFNKTNEAAGNEDQYAAVDDYNTSVASLNDFENTEP
jgi:hypothetical protein